METALWFNATYTTVTSIVWTQLIVVPVFVEAEGMEQGVSLSHAGRLARPLSLSPQLMSDGEGR